MFSYRRDYYDEELGCDVNIEFKVRDGDDLRIATVDEVLANQARHVWLSELPSDSVEELSSERPAEAVTPEPFAGQAAGDDLLPEQPVEAVTPEPSSEQAVRRDRGMRVDKCRFYFGTIKATGRKELLVVIPRFKEKDRGYMLAVAQSYHVDGYTVRWIDSQEGDEFPFGIDVARARRQRPLDQEDADHGQFPASSFQTITNAESTYDPSTEQELVEPFNLCLLRNVLRERLFDWPRRVGRLLFVPDIKSRVHYLSSPDELVSWLSRFGHVEWYSKRGCVSQAHLFHELVRSAPEYDAVEHFPHEPKMPTAYYSCRDVVPGDGRTFNELLNFFNPLTSDDRELIAAYFVTLIWGGSPGARPAFLVTAPLGRGKGKSKLAQLGGELVGGLLDFAAGEDIGIIKQRLLTPESMSKRVAQLDNVKSHRFSWAEWEALVTAKVVSGKRLYHGDASRHNALTWVVTTNGASLSTDVAQRTIEIKLANPKRSESWERAAFQFVNEHRDEIIADIVGVLRRPAVKLVRYSRWATWEGDVLSRMQNPDQLLRIIEERRGAVDVEADESGLIQDFFMEQLELHRGFFAQELGMHKEEVDLAAVRVFIPCRHAADWLCRALSERLSTVAACRRLDQLITEGRFENTGGRRGHIGGRNSSKKIGRGFIWFGAQAEPQSVLLKTLANVYGTQEEFVED